MDKSSLEPHTIAMLRELMGEDFPMLMEKFTADVQRLYGLLDAAVQAGDMKAIAETAHTMKSCTANVGAIGLYNILQQMESAARKAEAADYAQMLKQVQEMQAAVLKAVSVL